MSLEISSTQRFLKGKKIAGLSGKVASVMKDGNKRIVTDVWGNRLTITPTRLKAAFNRVLAAHQLKEALTTVRQLPNHRATMMLGGKEKGEKKEYSSRAAAVSAAIRHYHQAR